MYAVLLLFPLSWGVACSAMHVWGMYGKPFSRPFDAYHIPFYADARCKRRIHLPKYPHLSSTSLFHISSTSLHPRYNGAPVRCHAAPRGHAPRPPPSRARPAAGRLPRRGPPPRAVPHVPHVLRQGVPRRRVPRHPPPRRPCTSA